MVLQKIAGLHLAIEVPAENSSNEWLEPVDDEQYSKIE